MAALEAFLRDLPLCLAPGGRAAILTFHSGEDRRVKKAFKAGLAAGLYARVSDGVIRATPEERGRNPRSSVREAALGGSRKVIREEPVIPRLRPGACRRQSLGACPRHEEVRMHFERRPAKRFIRTWPGLLALSAAFVALSP